MRPIRAGFVGFGEINTPPDIIERKVSEAQETLEAEGLELVPTSPVSDDPEGKDVARALEDLAGQEFDLLILCLAGWIPSHAVIAIADRFRHTPMILLGLTGWQEEGRFVTTADQAGTTALRKPMQDLGYTFTYIPTFRGEDLPIERIMSYARAARAAAMLRGARIGTMGTRDMRLYGTQHDGVSLRARIGLEVEPFEMLEMAQAIEALDEAQVEALSAQVRERWEFTKEPQPGTIEN
ncbi:MAG: hypothetical protein GX131_09485, partial [candidate division WS1 bacterium]|nr:hypothetical protein [candidate division WS1 bacterium]